MQRMRSGKADAPHARHRRDQADEAGQVTHAAVGSCAGIGVDVLTQQRDLTDALLDQRAHLLQYRLQRAADLFATRIGHDAIAAELAAAFHDRHEGRGTLGAWRRQVIELLDLGKTDIDLRAATGAARGDELGQAMQGLRAEHQVDIGGPLEDGVAFLAGHTATDPDDELGALQLQQTPVAQQGIHLVFGLVAH